VVAFTYIVMIQAFVWHLKPHTLIEYGVFFWSVDYFTDSREEVGVPHNYFDTQTLVHIIMALCYLYLAFSH